MKLCELRKETGEPITKLQHEAVDAYYRALLSREDETAKSRHNAAKAIGR